MPEASTAVPSNAMVLFGGIQKAADTIQSKVDQDPAMLRKAFAMQQNGFQLNIRLVLDKTGSMGDDVQKVQQGMTNWLEHFYTSLPPQVREMYGDIFRVGGSITYFKDAQHDIATQKPFEVEIVPAQDVSQKPFIAQLKNFSEDNAGGNGESESSGEALTMNMDFGRNADGPGNPLMKKITNFIVDRATMKGNLSAGDRFKEGVKLLLESGMPPQIVILVTDELAKSTDRSWGLTDEQASIHEKENVTAFNEREFVSAFKSMNSKDRPIVIFAVPGADKNVLSYKSTVYHYWNHFAEQLDGRGLVVDLDDLSSVNAADPLFADLFSKTLSFAAVNLIEEQLHGLLTG